MILVIVPLSYWFSDFQAFQSMAIVWSSPPLIFARISALTVAVLVLGWALAFQTSFLSSSSSSQDHLIYSVSFFSFLKECCNLSVEILQKSYIFSCSLSGSFFGQVMHPLLMVIGFILVSGEGRNRIADLFFWFCVEWFFFLFLFSRSMLHVSWKEDCSNPILIFC